MNLKPEFKIIHQNIILLTTTMELPKKCKIREQSSLEHIFGFCDTSKKITKQLGFHLTIKTADLQDIV